MGELATIYLTLADALELYAAITGRTATDARNLLRSEPALEGALARPQSYAHYEDADLRLQAAVLAHGIAESQPFVDGNKAARSRRDADVPQGERLPRRGERP